ncbi:MAG: GAF domain-containing protein [Elainella sp. Prado103]|nr:GAF domain-containing protein [Elainella sp. Prado103]
MSKDDFISQIEIAQAQLATILADLKQQSPDSAQISQWEQVSQTLAGLHSTWWEQTQDLRQGLAKLQQQQQQILTQSEQDQAFTTIVQHLRQTLDPGEVVAQTVQATQQLLQADRSAIYQFKASSSLEAGFRLVAEAGDKLVSIDRADIPTTPDLTHFLGQVGAIVLDRMQWEGMTDLPTPFIQFVRQQQAISLVAAPIRQEQGLWGLLLVQQQTERNWQPYDIERIQQLSTEVGIALCQSELYQQSQRLNLDLERQVQQRTKQLENALKYESLLKRITDRVRDSLDERTILQAAVQELTLVLQLAGCNAALYDLTQGTSTVHYDYAQSIPGSQGRVAQMEHFPEIYHQLQQGWTFQFCSLLPNPARGQVAMLACPIFVDPHSSRGFNQSVLGDLWLINRKDLVFDEHEIRLVQQVASQCAIAIRQARLYQASQGQVQELAELNRLKDEFLSTVSHELRTPITNIKVAIQMVRNAKTEERRNKYLGILEQEAIREADLINDLLDLQQLQVASRPLDLEVLALSDWLSELVEPFYPRFAARQQEFSIDWVTDLPDITTEAAALQRILTELLNNACKYTAPEHQVYLQVRALPVSGDRVRAHLQFQIRNQALIPTVELPKLFDKFYRCPNSDPWKQGGTGLGLALVKKLVERLQGEIQVTSADGWTQFTVILPTSLAATTADPE